MGIKRICISSVAIALGLCGAFAQAQQSHPEAWQKVKVSQEKLAAASLSWTVRFERSAQPDKGNEEVQKAREQFRQQFIAQGLSGDELEQQLIAVTAAFTDTKKKTFWGKVVANADGRSVGIASFGLSADQPASKGAAEPSVREYWNGQDSSRLFQNQAQPGSVERGSPNPFGHAGVTFASLHALSLYRLENVFTPEDLKRIDGDFAYLERKLPERDNYVEMCKVQLSTGLPVETCIVEKSIGRVDYQCLVVSTKKINGHVIPAEVKSNLYDKNGKMFNAASYTLDWAEFGNWQAGVVPNSMGVKGVHVIDSRLGKGKEREYMYPGYLPSVDEAKSMGSSAVRAKPVAGPSMVFIVGALFQAALLLYYGLGRRK